MYIPVQEILIYGAIVIALSPLHIFSQYIYARVGEWFSILIMTGIFIVASLAFTLYKNEPLALFSIWLNFVRIAGLWCISRLMYYFGIVEGRKYHTDHYKRVYAYLTALLPVILGVGFLVLMSTGRSAKNIEDGMPPPSQAPWKWYPVMVAFLVFSFWVGVFLEHIRQDRAENLAKKSATLD